MDMVASFCLALLIATTFIHYEVLRQLSICLPALGIRARAKLIVVILAAFMAHAVEIFLYASAFYLLARYLGAGTLGDPGQLSFSRILYFSGETFTSLGYGDIVPHGALRLLAGMEALNGLLLIGWTASYTYIAMERFWDDGDQ
jgi:voltage-gated potassium channel Kch